MGIGFPESLPDLEQSPDHPLGHRARGDAGAVREDVALEVEARLRELLDARAAALDPPQVRHPLGDAIRRVERRQHVTRRECRFALGGDPGRPGRRFGIGAPRVLRRPLGPFVDRQHDGFDSVEGVDALDEAPRVEGGEAETDAEGFGHGVLEQAWGRSGRGRRSVARSRRCIKRADAGRAGAPTARTSWGSSVSGKDPIDKCRGTGESRSRVSFGRAEDPVERRQRPGTNGFGGDHGEDLRLVRNRPTDERGAWNRCAEPRALSGLPGRTPDRTLDERSSDRGPQAPAELSDPSVVRAARSQLEGPR